MCVFVCSCGRVSVRVFNCKCVRSVLFQTHDPYRRMSVEPYGTYGMVSLINYTKAMSMNNSKNINMDSPLNQIEYICTQI